VSCTPPKSLFFLFLSFLLLTLGDVCIMGFDCFEVQIKCLAHMLLSHIQVRKIRIGIPPELFDFVDKVKGKDDDDVTIEQQVMVVCQIKAKVVTTDFDAVLMLFAIGIMFVLSETAVG
jgi:hypothetical protein